MIVSILGDILTVFAPNTTGILYSRQRPVEMIKQLYDVGFLFDEAKDFEIVSISHQKNAAEVQYRKLLVSWKEVLDDTYQTSLILAQAGDQTHKLSSSPKRDIQYCEFYTG